MTLELYVVLPNKVGVEPGLYRAVYNVSLRHRFKPDPNQCQGPVTPEEGRRRLADYGIAPVRSRLPKAEAMGRRCWYCARLMNVQTIGEDDSAEVEHQVPRCTEWKYVERDENIVVACRQCNNSAYPGKGERDVQAFRERLQQHRETRTIVFYGEVLRWVRGHAAAFAFPITGLTSDEARRVLSWYLRNGHTTLHTWSDDEQEYVSGLGLPIPADAPPFALGAPDRLGQAPRAVGPAVEMDEDELSY